MHSLNYKLSRGLLLFSLLHFSPVLCYPKDVPGQYTDGSSFNALKQPYYPPSADCEDYMIPINISYDNLVFNATKYSNDYDLTDFLTTVTARPGAGYPAPLDGPKPTTQSVDIAASFCSPKKQTSKARNVIVATHGIGPARAHWNSPYKPSEHNFVQHAIEQGYSVFFYDRLGCGASQK